MPQPSELLRKHSFGWFGDSGIGKASRVATPLLAWSETRKAKSRGADSSGSRDVVQLVAVHAVPVDRAGRPADSTLCGVTVEGVSEDCPFHVSLTATRCITCAEMLGQLHVGR